MDIGLSYIFFRFFAEADFDSGSEASFSLTTTDSDDSLEDISPFDPNNTLSHNHHGNMRPRTHHYKRNTVAVTMMKGGIPKVSVGSKKPRGRPRKMQNFPAVDENGVFQTSSQRRGRGRREGKRGKHEFPFLLGEPGFF